MTTLMALVFGLASTAAQATQSESIELTALLEMAQTAAVDRDPSDQVTRLKDFASTAPVIEDPLLGELLSLLDDSTVHKMVRLELLELACVGAPQGLPRTVAYLDEQFGEFEELPHGTIAELRQKLGHTAPPLLLRFLKSCPESSENDASAQLAVLALATRVATSAAIPKGDRELRGAAVSCIANYPAPKSMKQEFVFEVISSYSDKPPPKALLDFIDDDLANRLRPFVLKGGDGKDDIHSGASIALADYGDQETGVLLERWAARQDDPVRAARHIERRLWRINARQNPELLLEYIKSEEWHGMGHRIWAMKKALSLGLPPEDVRKAILDYARVVKGHRGLESSLESLRVHAQKNGVLRDDDLPEVRKPPRNRAEMIQRMGERRKELQDE